MAAKKLSQAQIERLYKDFDKAFHHHGGIALQQKTLSRLESACKKMDMGEIEEVILYKNTGPLVTVKFRHHSTPHRFDLWTMVLTFDQMRHNKWAIVRLVKAMFCLAQCTKAVGSTK